MPWMSQFRFKKMLWLGAVAALTGCPKPGTMIRQYGYTELRPPSQLMAPGTMVWVQNTDPFQAGIICTQALSLGGDFKPMEAPTSNQVLDKAANTKVTLGVEYMNLVKATGLGEFVESLQAEVRNPMTYTVSDMDVINNISKRDPVCSQAISNRAKAGFAVTMISSALMADITYHVIWKPNVNLDVEMKIAALHGLAPHLGVAHAGVTDTTISGKNMFWGIMDDIYLAQLSANGSGTGGPSSGAPGPMPPREDGEVERAIPVDAVPAVEPMPDAATESEWRQLTGP